MNITKEQRDDLIAALEWSYDHDESLSPEMLARIREALIKSSGDKANGPAPPAEHKTAILLLQESGYFYHTEAERVRKDGALSSDYKQREREVDAAIEVLKNPAPSPAPLPKEVEEAMEKIITRLEGRDCSEEIVFIKAALRPKVASREWVDDLSARIDKIQFVTCPNDATRDTVERTIDELGYVVGDKP